MKVFGAKVIKEGDKDGRYWQMIGFTDERGRKLTTFDSLLLDLVDGSEVEGAVTEVQKGDNTYYNFKLAKHREGQTPMQIAPVTPQKASSVPQDVWDRKDRAMAWMNCNNAAATLFSGTGQGDEHIKHLRKLFAEYELVINGKETLSSSYAKVIERVPPTPPIPTEAPDGSIDLDSIPF